MWLLSTDTAELHFFPSPEQVPDGYAILSHVWDDREMSFQDLVALCSECGSSDANPRDHVPSKIRNACVLAANHGYQWLWADMCCIDKTSSSDLSEAINSMFRYYSLASVCYAYLRDVPSTSLTRDAFHSGDFWSSAWHQRGWTLQELLAPKLVVFVSSNWKVIGSKAEHANLLHQITRIPVGVLRLEQDLADVDVSQRMSWAAPRKTTRPEDEAYSLMGIFGINMSILYGEGRKAFYRLQEEIMKTSVDTSLFLWGRVASLADLRYHSRSRPSKHDHHSPDAYLLAPSPSCFDSVREDVRFNPSSRDDAKVSPSFTVPATLSFIAWVRGRVRFSE